MRLRHAAGAALALCCLVPGVSAAQERGGSSTRNTIADYTPVERFEPLAASSPCEPALDEPFVLPADYGQAVVADEASAGTDDLWDMNTQNETGVDQGRYVYRTHETTTDGEVSVTDLETGESKTLAERADWERLDGIVWTPWGTLLVAEEVSPSAVADPQVPQARAGLVYELFVDPEDPTQLSTDDPRDRVFPFDDGIAVRPAIGSRSHEGMRFDKHGNLYGISESNPGAIFRFAPEHKGDLSSGTLSALVTENGHDGSGSWVEIPASEAQVDAQASAGALGANGYNRPEDIETGESTGKDRSNGGNTLYVAITGSDEVLAIDLSSSSRPYAYDYVGHTAAADQFDAPAQAADFDSPDNLALDAKGNLAITEDPSTNTVGADIWIAAPPRNGRHNPASTVQRFASLKDCSAEPTGVYFAMKGTERYTEEQPYAEFVGGRTLFVNRQHSGLGTTSDQLVAIAPESGE